MESPKIAAYHIDRSLSGKRILFPIRLSDGSTSIKECEVLMRADANNIGYADISYNEISDGLGTSLMIKLSESEYKKLKPSGDRVIYK